MISETEITVGRLGVKLAFFFQSNGLAFRRSPKSSWYVDTEGEEQIEEAGDGIKLKCPRLERLAVLESREERLLDKELLEHVETCRKWST